MSDVIAQIVNPQVVAQLESEQVVVDPDGGNTMVASTTEEAVVQAGDQQIVVDGGGIPGPPGPPGPPGSGSTIAVLEDGGVLSPAVFQRINFIGAGVTAVPNADGITVDVTIPGSIGGALADGDKGDIIVSGGGTTWNVQTNGLAFNKLQQVGGGVLLGRVTGPVGDIQSLSPSTVKTLLALTKADVNLANVDNTSDVNKPISSATQAALNDKVNTSEKAAANGVATLGSDSKLPVAQLPDIAIKKTFVVASEAAQLVLTAQEGDQAVRTDINKTFSRLGTSLGTIADWQEHLTPPNSVSSVNGQTGVVVLDKTHVGLGNVDNTSDANKPISTATQTALNGKEPTIAGGTTSQFWRGDKTWQALIGLTDGDKGDITVSSSGTVWSIDANSVTLAKMAQVATGVFLGRSTAGTGNVEAMSAATAKTLLALTKGDVGLGNVDNTSDANKPVSTAQAAADDLRILLTEKGAANGVATLGADSKIPTSQLPALAISSTFVVNTQAEQLALTAQEGDVAVRTDLNKSFIRLATSLGTMADWQELLTPTDAVQSVNGQTGVVVLGKADVGLGNVDNTSDLAKPISTATQTALNAKEPTIAAGTTAQYWRGDKTWQTLPPGLTDGDKGDITVSSSGAAWSIDANAVTFAKMQQVATGVFIGRVTAATGNIETLTPAQAKTLLALVKADVGLGNVDNTSDANKPVSTAQQTALDLKFDKAGGAIGGNVDLTHATNMHILWNGGTNGRIYMSSAQAAYRHARHSFYDNAGTTEFARLESTGLDLKVALKFNGVTFDPNTKRTVVGLFTAAGSVNIPTGENIVETTGYSAVGVGAALYVYDAAVDATYVTNNPRTSFRNATTGRGYRLWNGQEIWDSMFGAVGDNTTNDYAALAALWNFAIANPGTRCRLRPLTYAVGTALPQISTSWVWIEGAGAEMRDGLAAEKAGTWLRYTGANQASGAVVTIAAVSGASNRRPVGVKFLGIGIDANGLYWAGLQMGGLFRCDIDVCVMGATNRLVDCFCPASLAESRTSQRCNIWLKLRAVEFPGALGIVLGGDSTANWSKNIFWMVDAVHQNATVIYAINVDNNIWKEFRSFKISGGTATESASMLGGASEPVSARAERFEKYSSDLPLHAYGTNEGFAYPCTNITIDRLDTDNGTPEPVMGTGATVRFRKHITETNEEKWKSWTPTVTAASGTITTVGAVSASYLKIGKLVRYRILVPITTNGTGAGAINVTLPSGLASVGNQGAVGCGKETSLTGKMVSAFVGGAGGTTLSLQYADGTYPGANGASITVSGFYECA